MELKNKYSKDIANYLYNDMSMEEREAFEQALTYDTELAEEYRFQAEAIEYIGAKVLLEEMKSDPDLADADRLVEEYFISRESGHRNLEKEKKSTPGGIRKIYRIGAAAAIFIGLLTIIKVQYHDPYNSLYKRYYSPFEETSNIYRGTNSDMDTRIATGINLYSQKEYENSNAIFKDLEISNPENPLISFYLGLTDIALNQQENAILQFEDHLNSFDALEPEVKWYLCLCYLKDEKVNKAYSLLQDLIDYPGKLGRDAKALERKIEKKIIK